MEIKKIYVANNGDIFFEHDCAYKELTVKEEGLLHSKADEAFKAMRAPIETCKAVEHQKPIPHLSYYQGETFIGEAGMHVTERFNPFQSFMYLKRVSERTESNEAKYILTSDLIPIKEYAEQHGVKADTVRQKILRGNLEAIKMGRNWMIDKNTPYKDCRKKVQP